MQTYPSMTRPAKRQAKSQRLNFIGKLLLTVFCIVLLEGAVRKWIFPSSTILLMGLRDLLVLAGIVYGFSHKAYRTRKWPEVILLIWTALVVVWTLLQIMAQIQPPIVGIIGLRNWLPYLWFSLVCFRALRRQDLEIIFRAFLFTLIPMVALAVYQHLMPIGHFINIQPDTDEERIFQVIAGVVRTTGTFSFTLGYTQYLAFMTPLVLWLAIGGFSIMRSIVLRNSLIIFYFIGVAVSGSRGAIIFTALMLVALLLAMACKGGAGLRRIMVILVLSTPIAGIIGLYFSDAIDATTTRFEQASESEDFSTRIISIALGSPELWENFSFIGHGIGAGSNAARAFVESSADGFLLGENELDRILNEGGLIGLLFYAAKLSIALLGSYFAWATISRDGEILPFLYWSYLTVQLFTAQITGQVTAHAFTFIALGIGLLLLEEKKQINRNNKALKSLQP